MTKDVIKEGLAFALGMVRISGEQFNKVIRELERRNKVSSKEGKLMVHRWLGQQQKLLEKLRQKVKREALRTKLYSSKDLAEMDRVIKRLSNQIVTLKKKKKKAEASAKKSKKKALRKRTARKKPAKRKSKKKKKR